MIRLILLWVSLIAILMATARGDSVEDLKSALGLTAEKELPEGLLDVVKSIGSHLETGTRAENELEWKEEKEKFLARGKDIKEYALNAIKDFLQKIGKDPVEYIGDVMEIPFQLIARFIEKAPWSDWQALYEVYMKNPQLIPNIAKANKKLVYSYYSIILGDKEDLDRNLDLYLYWADVLHKAHLFLSTLRSHVIVEGPNKKKKSKTSPEKPSNDEPENDKPSDDLKSESFASKSKSQEPSENSDKAKKSEL